MDRKNKRAAQHQQQGQGNGGNGNGNGQAPSQIQNQTQNQQAGGGALVNANGNKRGQPGHRRDRDSRGDLVVPQMQGQAAYMGVDAGGSRGGGYPFGVGVGARDVDFPFGLPDDFQQFSGTGGPSVSHTNGNARSNWQNRLSSNQLDHDGRGPGAGAALGSSLGRSHDTAAERYEASGRSGIALGSPVPGSAFGTSPFSHPGSHSLFYSESATVPGHLDDDGPHARAMRNGAGPRSMGRLDDSGLEAASRRAWGARSGRRRQGNGMDGGEDDDDDEAFVRATRAEGFNEEEFLPSSLSELLTPAELERKRRSVITSDGSHQRLANMGAAAQSMPAGSAASLWDLAYRQEAATNRSGAQPGAFATKDAAAAAAALNALGSSHLDGSRAGTDVFDHGNGLGMSNSSAGFLASRLQRSGERLDSRLNHQAGVIGRDREDAGSMRAPPGNAYSPDAQAALSHAPGQSLPQGLAAGLSRLHLRAGESGVVAGGHSQQQAQLSHNAVWPPTTSSTASSLLPRQSQNPSSTHVSATNNNHSKVTARPSLSSRPSNSHLDDLAPTAPSSLFPHRPSPLSSALANRHGTLSSANASPLLDSQSNSPGGIAIPGQQEQAVTSTGHQSIGGKLSGVSPSIRSHPGIQRLVRPNGSSSAPPSSSSANLAPSPLALLPTTGEEGEEVEEAIFELE